MKKAFAILLIIILFVGLTGCTSTTHNQSTTTPVSTSVNIGDNVILDNDNQDKIIVVAVTKADLDELVKLSVAGDKVGFAKMILDGYAFMVDKGTKALIIDEAYGEREVRIMSGDYYSESGWVIMEDCKKP
jgi:type IV secretory pathway TrbF-like protein